MIIAKRLKGKAIAAWLGSTGDAVRGAVSAVRNSVSKSENRLELYFDIADPWSYLAAQATKRLIDAYQVPYAIHVVTPPASDVDPAPESRAKHAVRDAAELAQYWNLDFGGKRPADSGIVRDVGTVLVKERSHEKQLAAILELCPLMWATDRKGVARVMGVYGTEGHNSVPPILNENYAALRRAGHYQGAMIKYGDTWYWGIDRLAYLEEALARDTGRPVAHVVTPRPEAERAPERLSAKPLVCEMWFSFRSPYSYLALEQIEAVLAPYKIPLQLRPVLPMVSRGLAVPSVKRMYIVRDAKREADRLNIPFGELCDPLGAGVDNCVAIAKWAGERGAGLAFARSAMRGIWTEAKDMAEYVDLRSVVERANLPWEEAKAQIGKPEIAKWTTLNAADLAVVSLWGVPSFRVGDFATWGNDRIPMLADRLRRHALAPEPAVTAETT